MYAYFSIYWIHPDYDTIGSKHVAVWTLYKVVFGDYLFDSYFIIQQNGTHNFKIKNGAAADSRTS